MRHEACVIISTQNNKLGTQITTIFNRRRAITHRHTMEEACKALKQARDEGCGLLVLTGAGMSVSSKVPVFRSADGSMSPEFLAFLKDYNVARERHGLPQVEDWFQFSVPEMFQEETAKEAWAYWRWRIVRARVEPGLDYHHLSRIMNAFCISGTENSFIITSNCDGLHLQRDYNGVGVDESRIQEIHGSLSRLQCSVPCCQDLWPVDAKFIDRLEKEPDWVPMCPECKTSCLRPNVMIFGDDALVCTVLHEQHRNKADFQRRHPGGNWIVLEIGAGVVVASIRYKAERLASQGKGLVRINPSQNECDEMETVQLEEDKYFPIVATSSQALERIADVLEADEVPKSKEK